ncbi:MAG TPA: cellulose synthase, partial [bacterium]|nr:cellulose synthase [bacterium]
MKLTNLLICFLVVIINLAVWLYINKPYHPVNSHYPLNGMCFNPFQKNQTPYDGVAFNAQDMEKDLAVLSDKTKTVRVYTATNGMDQLPKLAEKFGLNIVLTAWLDSRAVSNNNQTEVNSAIQLTGRNRNIKRLLIGNETQLHKSVPREELITYLDEARRRLKTPVSTAESWDYWLNNPDLADHVDFIAIHVLPYWVGIPIEEAADYVLGKYWALKERFPEKKIIITEAGWPSEGPQRGSAVPSLINQAMFIRSFVR